MTLATLTRQDIAAIVAAAVLAPSVLNTQPWRFVARDNHIDLYADRSRALPISDPDERALCISCGAALMNLRLAMASNGWTPVIDLLPGTGDATHLARVYAGDAHETTDDERAHSMAIPLRRTTRLPFTAQALSQDDRSRLEQAARVEGASLHFLTGLEVPYVMRTVHEADAALRTDAAVRDEIRQWINRPKGAPDGLSADVLGPSPSGPHAAIRDFTMGEPTPERGCADFETLPTLAVLHTWGEGQRDWLVAGQALERVLLAATSQGMASSLLTQPLEVPWLRRLLTHPADRTLVPQALIRLGFCPGGPLTSRRQVADVLTFG